MRLGCGSQECCLKFIKKLSTLVHSTRCRRQTTAIRTFIKDTTCTPRMGASFRANLMLIHAKMARYCRDGQTDGWTDGQTDGFSALYSRFRYC